MKNQLGLAIVSLVVALVTVGCSAVVKSDNSAPQLSYVSPKGVAAGSPTFILNVVGSNFRPHSSVFFKGLARETRLISETQLAASIPSTDVAQPGTVEVVVADGEPRHGFIRSNVLAFDVTPPSAGLQITTNSLPDGSVGRRYSANVAVSGGIPAHTWNISSGQLPSGLLLSTGDGAIFGTPAEAGQFNFTVQVADSSLPNPQNATKRLSLNVGREALPLVVNTATLPDGVLQIPYAAALAAAGGIQPYRWSIASGSLPQGLTLSASAGSIAGAPTRMGGYTFTVQVEDSATPPKKATKSLVLTVSPRQLQITTNSLPGGVVGVSYAATLSAANGMPPYVWSISSGQLPPGLVLQAPTGGISGTPTQSGAFAFLVRVGDSSGQTAPASFGVNIAPASAPSVSNVSPNSGSVSGGTPVTVLGANFQPGAAVVFGNVAAPAVTVSSASQIQVVTPAHGAGTVDITVRNPDGQSGTLSGGFVYHQLPLTIAGVSPNNGYAAGGTRVSIRGTGFLAGALVLFGNVAASTVSTNSPTEIQALTPAHSVGVVDVVVQNPDGQSATLAGGFRYEESPSGHVLLSDGFETGDFRNWDYVGGYNCDGCNNPGPGTKGPCCGVSMFSGDPNYVHSGNYSAQFQFCIPPNYPEHQDDNQHLQKFLTPEVTELWVRGYVKFKTPSPVPTPGCPTAGGVGIGNGRKMIGYTSNFQDIGINEFSGSFTGDDCAPYGLCGGAHPPADMNVRINVHPIVNAFDFGSTNISCNRTLSFETWYSVEVHWLLNTPGLSDGAIDVWVDGQLCTDPAQSHGISVRSTLNKELFFIAIGQQADRTGHMPVNELRYWDDIVISTSGYIGP